MRRTTEGVRVQTGDLQSHPKLDVAGARRDRGPTVDIPTTWKSQFATPKGISGCFDAAKEMVLQGTPPGAL
jgi:hypothetical protein